MTGANARIRALYDGFSPAQRKVADFVIAHAGELPFLSVHELAEEAGVSIASISRFARHLGFEGFKDFKSQLGKDALPSLETVYQAIAPTDSDGEIVNKVFSGNIRSLNETLAIMSEKDLVGAAKAIAKARRVVFFGIGSSGHVAADAALRFSQLDLPAQASVDAYGMLNQALGLGKNDVAFGISHTGRSSITVEALRMASQRRATTVGMSNHMQSPLHQVCDRFLCTSFPESRVRVAALSSRVAQTCLIDALYLLVARHAEKQLRKAEELNAVTEELLRRPVR